MNCWQCRAQGEFRPAVAKGLCTMHYQRMKKHGTLDDLGMTALPNGYCSKRDSQGRKICSTCRDWLPENQFGPSKTARDGLRPVCKICRRLAQLRVSRVVKYSLSSEDIEEMLIEQDHICPICQEDINELTCHVDHDHACCPSDHTCGHCVRGLLCATCNHGLGRFKDRIELLTNAITYLERKKVAA